jgi:chromatin assembly factor 1 subunit B
MVYPNIIPPSLVEAASNDAANPPVPRPPRVEYLATLSRHSAPVNVVRFSPNGATACPYHYASLPRIYIRGFR